MSTAPCLIWRTLSATCGVLCWGLWQCHYRQMCGLGNVWETLPRPHHQATFPYDTTRCAWSAYAWLCGSEMRGPKTSGLQRLHRNDRSVISWICGTKDWDETHSASLLRKLSIKDITAVLHSRRIGWYRHVQCVTSSIKFATGLAIPGPGGVEGLERHVPNMWRMVSVLIHKTGAWRAAFRCTRMMSVPSNGTQTAP